MPRAYCVFINNYEFGALSEPIIRLTVYVGAGLLIYLVPWKNALSLWSKVHDYLPNSLENLKGVSMDVF